MVIRRWAGEAGAVTGPWLRLVRVPNLFTVPGDVLAGFWLARGFGPVDGAVVWAVAAGVGIYVIGLMVNDWVDREEDRRLRQGRPLAREEIGMGAFWGVLACLWAGSIGALLGAGVPTLVTGVCVLSLAISYSLFLRRWVWAGVGALGLCRAGLVLMGALAGEGAEAGLNVGLAVGTVFGWIVLVSLLARDEAGRDGLRPRFHPGWLAAYVLGAGTVWLVAGEFRSEMAGVVFGVFGLFLAWEAWRPAGRYWLVARDRPKIVGQWLGLLILMQAWLILPVAGWVAGLGVVAGGSFFWGIRGWLARSFAAS